MQQNNMIISCLQNNDTYIWCQDVIRKNFESLNLGKNMNILDISLPLYYLRACSRKNRAEPGRGAKLRLIDMYAVEISCFHCILQLKT